MHEISHLIFKKIKKMNFKYGRSAPRFSFKFSPYSILVSFWKQLRSTNKRQVNYIMVRHVL